MVGNLQLSYREYGKIGAPPILLLHGLGGAASTWTKIASLLSNRYRIIIPDLVGFGQSPRPKKFSYSVDEHLTALDDFLQAHNLVSEPLGIVGYSMGAILAAEYASRHLIRIQSLVLISLPYFRSSGEALDQLREIGILAWSTASGNWFARSICEAMCAFRPVLKIVAPRIAPHLPHDVAQDTLEHNFASFSRSLRNVIIEHRVDDALSVLGNFPLVLIHGNEDQTAPLKNVQTLALRNPNWKLETIRDADHYLPIQEPEFIAQVIDRAVARR